MIILQLVFDTIVNRELHFIMNELNGNFGRGYMNQLLTLGSVEALLNGWFFDIIYPFLAHRMYIKRAAYE